MYDVSKRGKRPIYEYLYICIRDDIVNGRIKGGEKLLSKRRMAMQEGVALITVENAYAQLLVEGYIESRQRSGYYAVSGAYGLGDSKNFAEKVHESKPLQTGQKSDQEKVIADFVSQRLFDDAFPFAIWSKLMRTVLSDRSPECLETPDPCGLEVLRRAISGYLKRSRGIDANPDNIIVGPGTEYLENLLLILSGGGALTAVEDPGYKKMGLLCERAGHKCLHIPVTKDGMDVSSLLSTSVKLVNISPSHQFPTGAVMSAGKRAQLLEWALREDAYIAEDDYDSEFRFYGRPIPPIAATYPDRVVYMNTFTRTLAPSIRIAYMLLPDRLMEQYRQKLYFYSGTVSSFEQLVLSEFINEGYYERHLSRMRNYYGKRRENIMKIFMQKNHQQIFEPIADAAGLCIILKAPSWLDDNKFMEEISSKGIKMNCMNDYCYSFKKEYEHLFPVSFGAANEDDFIKALPVMEEVAAKCRQTN